jgi:ELWxxDGT repeat protein
MELWYSDGTETGTRLVADIRTGAESSGDPEAFGEDYWTHRDIVCLGERAVLAANDGVHGSELWVTDGTAEGTALLADLYFGSYPSRPRRLTRAGDRAFFAAEDDLHGLELFVTDGTPTGTRLARDIAPGPESSAPQALTAHGELVLLSAWTGSFGREAWRSDGTAEGTVRITDLAPGPASSSPDRFAVLGERLFFSATDLVHGFELFSLVDPELAAIFRDGFEVGSTARWDAVGAAE